MDVEVEVGPKDVTVIDVLGSDVQVEDVALDVAPDAPPTTCSTSKPFGSFINLGAGVDTGAFESSPSLTSDELTMLLRARRRRWKARPVLRDARVDVAGVRERASRHDDLDATSRGTRRRSSSMD